MRTKMTNETSGFCVTLHCNKFLVVLGQDVQRLTVHLSHTVSVSLES